MKETNVPLCEIVYVKRPDRGWKWRSIEPEGKRKVSEQTFPLFYDCVRAARAKGYEPNVKCL